MQYVQFFTLALVLVNVIIMSYVASKLDVALQPVVALQGALNTLTAEVDRLTNRISLVNVVGEKAADVVTSAASSRAGNFVKDSAARILDQWKPSSKKTEI